MTVNEFISADNEKIEKILNDYPKQIPCPVVAELLGCKPDGVRQAIAEGAFGIHWRLQGKLTSGNCCIPTAQFVRWYLNMRIT